MALLPKVLGSMILFWLYLISEAWFSLIIRLLSYDFLIWAYKLKFSEVVCVRIYDQDWGYIHSERISICLFQVHQQFHIFRITFMLILWLCGSWTICLRIRSLTTNFYGRLFPIQSLNHDKQTAFDVYLYHLKDVFAYLPFNCQ